MALEFEETQMIKSGFAAINASLDKIAQAQTNTDQKVDAIRNNMINGTQFHQLMDNVDGLVRQFTDHHEDHQIADGQADRLQRQIEFLATKLGVPVTDLPR